MSGQMKLKPSRLPGGFFSTSSRCVTQAVDAALQLGECDNEHHDHGEVDGDVQKGDEQSETAPERRDDQRARGGRWKAGAGTLVVDSGTEAHPEEADPIDIEERNEHESDRFAGAGIIGAASRQVSVS